MESKSAFIGSYVTVFLIISEILVAVHGADITVNGRQMLFSPDPKPFLTSDAFSDECQKRGLHPLEDATVLLRVQIAQEMDSLPHPPRISAWLSGQSDSNGDFHCFGAFYNAAQASYTSRTEDCSTNHYFLCTVPKPQVLRLSSPSVTLKCSVETFSFPVTYSWALTSGDTLTILSTTTINHSIGTVSADKKGYYTCSAEVSGIKSQTSDPLYVVDAGAPQIEAPTLHVGTHRMKPRTNHWISCTTHRLDVDIYLWKRDGQIVDKFDEKANIAFLLNVNHNDTGNYTCSLLVNGMESLDSNVERIEMIVPTPSLIVDDGYIGQETRLICQTAYSGEVPRQFLFYKKALSGAYSQLTSYGVSNSILTIPKTTPDHAGKYACQESIGGLESSFSADQALTTYIPQPTIVAEANYSRVILGDSTVLKCNTGYPVSPGETFTRLYKWYRHRNEVTSNIEFNDGDLSDLNTRTSADGFDWRSEGVSPTTTLISFGIPDAVKYSCAEIIGNRVSALSKHLQLYYEDLTPVLEANETIITLGSSVKLTCNIGMTPPSSLTFQFDYKNATLPPFYQASNQPSGNELTINSFQENHFGFYSCAAETGATIFASNVLSVPFQIPRPTVETTSPGDVVVPIGEKVVLVCKNGYSDLADSSGPFSGNPAVDLNVVYTWNWRSLGSSTINRTWTESSQDYTELTQFFHDYVGKYSCVQSIQSVASSESPKVTIRFSVPQPEIEWLDKRVTSVDIAEQIMLNCTSAYNDEALTRRYKLFYKLNETDVTKKAASGSSSTFSKQPLLPFMSCSEFIETIESPKSNWIEFNITVQTPSILERWDEDSKKVEVTCIHAYIKKDDLRPHTELQWFQYGTVLHTDSFIKPARNKIEVDYVDKATSGNFSCSVIVHGLSSNISSDSTSEDIINNPTIISSSQARVPSGSRVKLTCTFRLTYSLEYYWKLDGKSIRQSKSNEFRINKFVEANNGYYTCSITTSEGDFKESDPVILHTVDPFAVCYCPCGNTTKASNVTKDEVKEIISTLKANLTVPKDALSATIREKTSAPDERPSSVSAGAGAIVIITGCILLIVVPDAIRVVLWLIHKIQYFSGKTASVDIAKQR